MHRSTPCHSGAKPALPIARSGPRHARAFVRPVGSLLRCPAEPATVLQRRDAGGERNVGSARRHAGGDPVYRGARSGSRAARGAREHAARAGIADREERNRGRGPLGTYQTTPLYDRASQITGWRVRAELVLESRDFKTVSTLAGKLQPAMKLAGMSFSLSRAAREKAEASLLAEALRKFQAKAEAIAKTFGIPRLHAGPDRRAQRRPDCPADRVSRDGRRANGRCRRTAAADGRGQERGDRCRVGLGGARSGEVEVARAARRLPFIGCSANLSISTGAESFSKALTCRHRRAARVADATEAP